jgi:HAE1 family hydrophobic/amphiphilic exporter-1
VAMLATFVLLTVEFTSYGQPLVVMAVIPFGIVGAIWGHAFMGLPLTLFSILGLVALTGVVVNDSIVLVDFINARIRSGTPLREAVLEAGQRRFRPVLLTSMTTIAGLLPILNEKSFQAQLVIPMATSLCFGLLLSTLLVLVLVPTFYLVYGTLFGTHAPDQPTMAVDQPDKSDVPAAPVL